ncbi:MAG: DMT family transporter [Sandaracinaceae bacterium]|nr:DMT family transporter [Sandaracinaceae bacterium]
MVRATAMALHTTSGRASLGLSLALATAALWATLPVALAYALEALDPYTLTWFRFLVAFVLFGAWVVARGGVRRYRALDRRGWGLLSIAAVMLTCNYVGYLLGLHRTTPANSQLLIQLAPFLMAMGGILVFGERFTRAQWIGSAVLLLGLGLFFRDQLGQVAADPARYLEGSAFIAFAAVTWAVYALCQKQLLRVLTAAEVLAFIFGFATLALLPTADLAALGRVEPSYWIAIGYAALNTLAAYGCFAEALAHVEASRVSAMLALNPLMTLGVVTTAHAVLPLVFPESHVAWLGVIGALVTVAGSMVVNLGGKKRPA